MLILKMYRYYCVIISLIVNLMTKLINVSYQNGNALRAILMKILLTYITIYQTVYNVAI